MRANPICLVAMVLISTISTLRVAEARQKPDGKPSGESAAASSGQAISQTATPAEIARIAIARHGGEKFRSLKSVSLLGSAELYYGSKPAESTVGKFAMVQSGERARTDIETPDLKYREIYDGKKAYGSVSAGAVAPPTKFGLGVLTRFDQSGYSVTALPDKKNQRGFRITDSESNSTDFYADQTTGRIAECSFDYNGIKFLIEYKSFKEVEGVLVPVSFLRKLGLPRVDIFMEFKVKEAKVNQPVADDVFIIPDR